MRCLVDVHLAVASLESWDIEPACRVAEHAVVKCLREQGFQRRAVVSISANLAHMA